MTSLSVGETLTVGFLSSTTAVVSVCNALNVNVSYLAPVNLNLSGDLTLVGNNVTIRGTTINVSATNFEISAEYVAVRPYIKTNFGGALPALGGLSIGGCGTISALSVGVNFVGWGVLGVSTDSLYTTNMNANTLIGDALNTVYFETAGLTNVGAMSISCVSNRAAINMGNAVTLAALSNVFSLNCSSISGQRFVAPNYLTKTIRVNNTYPIVDDRVGRTASIPIAALTLSTASSGVFNFGSVTLSMGQYLGTITIQHTVSSPLTTQVEATLGLVDTAVSTPIGLPFGALLRSRMPLNVTGEKLTEHQQTYILDMSATGTKFLNLAFNNVFLSQRYRATAEFVKIC